ncbi:MAG: hypothetical protein U9Q62_07075 [Campylobacterota bacterium]|nr:hypothetical protein [Campylobacterota bacterium]
MVLFRVLLLVGLIVSISFSSSAPEFDGTYVQKKNREWIELPEHRGISAKIKLHDGTRLYCWNMAREDLTDIPEINADDFKLIAKRIDGKVYYEHLSLIDVYRYPDDTKAHATGYGDIQIWHCDANRLETKEKLIKSENTKIIKPKNKPKKGLYAIKFITNRKYFILK